MTDTRKSLTSFYGRAQRFFEERICASITRMRTTYMTDACNPLNLLAECSSSARGKQQLCMGLLRS